MKNSTKKIIEHKRRNPVREDEYYGFSEEEKRSFIVPVFRFVEWRGYSNTSFDETIMMYNGEMEFQILVGDPPAFCYNLICSASGMDYHEVAKKCVQRLLNKEFSIRPSIYFVELKGDVDFSKMRYDFSDAPEPWKTFFEQLFMDSSWTFDRPLIEQKTKISN